MTFLADSTTCVRFSPTGTQWAAASSQGLLIYSLDESLSFNPLDLDMDVTPQAVMAAIREQQWAKAVVVCVLLSLCSSASIFLLRVLLSHSVLAPFRSQIALRLNDSSLLWRCLDLTPVHEIPLVVTSLPTHYLPR